MADASLSQDEIEALLSGADEASGGGLNLGAEGGAGGAGGLNPDSEAKLNEIAKTIASAQASSIGSITGKSSTINVTVAKTSALSESLGAVSGNVLVVKVNYTSPESGNVFFIFKEEDGLKLAGLMTGGEPASMDEMAMSAVQEAFNQMNGASDTAISSEHGVSVDNGGPKLSSGSVPDNITIPEGNYFSIEYSISVEDSINSSYVQLIPVPVAQALSSGGGGADDLMGGGGDMDMDSLLGGEGDMGGDVDIQGAEFSPLVQTQDPAITGNINLLLDVPMEVTVELGRSTKTVQEVLSLGEGSIIELDKLAGEPVDLLVNGKPIAKGEVVVIDENFGVRVTEIVSPKQRISSAG